MTPSTGVVTKNAIDFFGAIQIAIANQRNLLQIRLDLSDAIPIGVPAKHILRRTSVYRQRSGTGTFDDLGNVNRVDLVASATKANFCGDWCGGTGL